MTLIRNLVVFAVTVSLFTFVAFFGRLPAFRNTPIGFLHRLLVLHGPSWLRTLDVKLTGGRITNGASRLGDYLMNDKHPVVMIFFLGLVTISVALFVPATWSRLPLQHKLLIPFMVPLPYLFTYLSAKPNQRTHITESNHAVQMQQYPYDRMLYYPGIDCRTCKFFKPARSKHCSICKSCVARCDHHCIWVNNCLGRGNYKYFLALLLSAGILIAYGAFLAYITLTPQVHAEYAKLEAWYQYKPAAGANLNSWNVFFSAKLYHFLTSVGLYLEVGGISAGGVGLLALLTWPLPLGLLAYQLYLVYAGMTTNESAKWADWRDDIADGLVYMGKRREDTMQDQSSYAQSHHKQRNISTSSGSISDPAVAAQDEEPPTSWPVESRHILLRTSNGRMPSHLHPKIAAVAAKDSFEQIWDLGIVENTYDLGFWDNLVDIFKN